MGGRGPTGLTYLDRIHRVDDGVLRDAGLSKRPHSALISCSAVSLKWATHRSPRQHVDAPSRADRQALVLDVLVRAGHGAARVLGPERLLGEESCGMSEL